MIIKVVSHATIAALILIVCAGAQEPGADHPDKSRLRAEVQINLCSEPQYLIGSLNLKPEASSPREAWYFDTQGLDLFQRGLVFRLRLFGGKAELTMKVADQDCMRLNSSQVPPGEGKCEYDMHGTAFKGVVSLVRGLDRPSTHALLDGSLPLAKALSPAQVRYLQSLSVWPLPAGVNRLGPVQIQPYRAKGRRYIVEMWRLPADESFIEISQKAAYKKALQLRTAIANEMAQAGIAVCADQSSQAGNKLRALTKHR